MQLASKQFQSHDGLEDMVLSVASPLRKRPRPLEATSFPSLACCSPSFVEVDFRDVTPNSEASGSRVLSGCEMGCEVGLREVWASVLEDEVSPQTSSDTQQARVFKVPRPVPPSLQSPRGFVERFPDAILHSRGDARGARRVLFHQGQSGMRQLTWQISFDSNVFTIQLSASLSGRRRVVVNGDEIHSEFRPVHRFSLGPVPLQGAYPHSFHIHQPSLRRRFAFQLFVDGEEFEELIPGITPLAAQCGSLFPSSPHG